MTFKKLKFLFFAFFVFSLIQLNALFSKEPVAYWLSWQNNPSTTMLVRWLTKAETTASLEYREKGTSSWKEIQSQNLKMPYDLPYLIHYVEITGLIPNKEYEFRFESDKIHRFKTMPGTLTEPLSFIVGGDIYHDELQYTIETQRVAASFSPSFAVLGGDIAYSAPKVGLFKEDAEKWIEWLKSWTETMVTKEGLTIPLLPVIGNHEVIGRYGQTKDQAIFYYALLVAPGSNTNYVMDFGNYMSLIVLDSGHTQLIAGKQTEWLNNELNSRVCVPHRFAIYHVPAWPSIRKYEYKVSKEIRTYWVPIFERYHLTAAFEHHDHAYKRTYPISDNKIDFDKGVLYLGDGAFGVKKPRLPKTKEERWYIAKGAPERHFILVTLKGCLRNYKAINSDGKVFDEINN